MKKLSYLLVLVAVLALIVLRCDQDTASSPSEDEVILQLNQVPEEFDCCPKNFTSVALTVELVGTPPDRNGDGGYLRGKKDRYR